MTSYNPLLGRRVLLCALSLFPLLALCSTIPTTRTTPDLQTRDELECGFKGDDNTYGLGIRLGLYLQWITTSLAYNFVPEEAVTMRGINNWFQAAIFAGLLYITIKKGPEMYAVEAFIILIFCMGGVCLGENPNTEQFHGRAKKWAYHSASNLGSLARFTLGVGFCVYGVWLTWKGMDGMQRGECGAWAFFLVRVDLYGWYRVFWKIWFLVGVVVYAVMILVGSVVVVGYVRYLRTEVRKDPGLGKVNSAAAASGSGQQSIPLAPTTTSGSTSSQVHQGIPLTLVPTSGSSSSQARPSTPPNLTTSPTSSSTISTQSSPPPPALVNHSGRDFFFSSALVFFIAAAETMIRWNNIHGVNDLGSTGQLVPLIIGIGGLLRVVQSLLRPLLRRVFSLEKEGGVGATGV